MQPLMTYLKWELNVSLRAGGTLVNGLSFFTVFIILMPISVTLEATTLSQIAPGLLWLGCLLSVLIALDRLFVLDIEDGGLDLMYLSSLPLEAVILVKTFVHWITTGLPVVILSPLFAITLNLSKDAYSWLLISLFVGTPALSFIGAIGASLTVSIKRSSLLVAIVVIPLYIPTLIFGTKLIQLSATNESKFHALAFLTAITLFSLVISPFISALAIKAHWRY